MRRVLYIFIIVLCALSCQRRDLTYGYYPTCEVVVEVDWRKMSENPTGMSLYFYPQDGGKPIVKRSNNISSVTVKLPQGVYDILIFNQIQREYVGVEFVGLDKFESAEICAVKSKSAWAVSRSESELVRDPEEVAISTYRGFEVTQEAVREILAMRSKGTRVEDIEPYAVLEFTPEVVTRLTSVRIRLSHIDNLLSTRATLYGMASGYNISEQKSHAEMSTHVLEQWSKTGYDDNGEGEVNALFRSFGLPDRSIPTRAVADWDGEMKIDFLLVDSKTIVSHDVELSSVTTENDRDEISADVDISIASGFGVDVEDESDDEPLVLPDVTPSGGNNTGFKPSIGNWEKELNQKVEI